MIKRYIINCFTKKTIFFCKQQTAFLCKKIYNNNKGLVLVEVLALIMLLLGVLMEFTYRTKVQLDIQHHQFKAKRINHALESAIAVTKAYLAHSFDPDSPEMLDWIGEGKTKSIDDVDIQIRLEPESAKLNLNNMVAGDGSIRIGYFQPYADYMLSLADMLGSVYDEPVLTYDTVFSILEWITDEDALAGYAHRGSLPGENGNGEYYDETDPPYACKHRPLSSISELLLVKGITEKELYGRPATEDEPALPGIADFLTVYGNSVALEAILTMEGTTEREKYEFLTDAYPLSHFLLPENTHYFTLEVTASSEHTQQRIKTVLHKDGRRVKNLYRGRSY